MITKVTFTHNLQAATSYVAPKNNKPHNASKLVNKRVLASTGINAPNNPKDFVEQGRASLKGKHRKVHAIRKIISFSPKELNPYNPNDVKKAINISVLANKKQFSHSHPQIYVVAQDDGRSNNKYHIPALHTHSIIINNDLQTGRAVTPKASWRNSVKWTDFASRRFGLTPINKPISSHRITNSAAIHINQRSNSYLFHLRASINNSLKQSKNIVQFGDNLASQGIQAQFFRRSHGQLHLYNTPGKDNIPYQNHYLRFKKHFTYSSFTKFKQRIVCRPKKLGLDTDKNNIIHILKYNQTHKENRGINITRGSKVKNNTDSQNQRFRENKKITFNELNPVIKQRNYLWKDCGPQYSNDQLPKLKVKQEPLQHPLLSFHPAKSNKNLALGRLFHALRMPQRSKEERAARDGAIEEAKAKFTEKAAAKIKEQYNERCFIFLERQQNRAILARYNWETKRALWLQRQELEHQQQGPVW